MAVHFNTIDGDAFYYASKGFDLDDVVELARLEADSFDAVDTLIGVGLSGALVVPHLAWRFHKHFCIVRKEAEMAASHNHASHRPAQGRIGDSWAFIDDFIIDGYTRDRAIQVVEELAPESRFVGVFLYDDESHGPWSLVDD